MVFQKEIRLQAQPRGFHIITSEITKAIKGCGILTGTCHIFIQHTSASLTINENADSLVRQDFESFFNHTVSEDIKYFKHTYEGPDDMPAHIKSSLLGSGITVPITNGNLNLGTWQGVYICEHRDDGGSRRIVITIIGE